MRITADIVIAGEPPAVLAAAIDAAGRGLQVVVVTRCARKGLASRLRGMMRAAGIPRRRLGAVLTGAEVVVADGVGKIEAVVVRQLRSGRVIGINASQLALVRPGRTRLGRYFTSSSSTSNTSVALGGITPPAPRAP